ncbi:MAG: hypothetical protein ACOVMP_00445, partial [Chthoniobacterales bacterium]
MGYWDHLPAGPQVVRLAFAFYFGSPLFLWACMSLHRIIPRLIGRIVVVSLITTALAADDPASQFLQAYQEFRTAERLEQQDRPKEASEKYEEAVRKLEAIRRKFPEFEPVVIEFRLRKSRENLSRLETAGELPMPQTPAGDAGLDALPQIDAPAITPQQSAPTQAQPPTGSRPRATYRIPIPPIAPRPSESAQRPPVSPSLDSTAAEREIASLRLRLSQAEQRAADMNEQLLQTMAREQSALHEIDRTKVVLVDLRSQLAQSRQAIGDLKDSNASLQSKTQVFTERLGALEGDLEAARADLEVAEDYNAELFQKLESAAAYIASSDQIRTELITERDALNERFKSGMDEEMKRLARETEKLQKERDQLAEKLVATAAIEKEKQQIEKDLADAQTALKAATDKGAGLEGEASNLREEIESITAEKNAAEKSLADLASKTDGSP